MRDTAIEETMSDQQEEEPLHQAGSRRIRTPSRLISDWTASRLAKRGFPLAKSPMRGPIICRVCPAGHTFEGRSVTTRAGGCPPEH